MCLSAKTASLLWGLGAKVRVMECYSQALFICQASDYIPEQVWNTISLKYTMCLSAKTASLLRGLGAKVRVMEYSSFKH